MIQYQKFERRWVIAYATIVMILLVVPFLIGFSSQTTEQHFSGGIIGIEDTNSYLAKMNQGAHGAWMFTLPYSSEPQHGAPLYWFYLLLGKISGAGFLNRVIVFQLARTFFGFLLILIVYRFLAEFLPRVNQRRLALIIVTLGGGLGWLLILFGNMNWFNSLPLEFYSPESFSFLMLLTLPHLLAARCLFILALLTFLHRRYVWSGLTLIFLSLIQPAEVIIVWAIIGLFSVINLIVVEKSISRNALWKNLYPTFLTTMISAPLLMYIGYLFLSDPILNQWSVQNVLPSPHPLHYISGYGPYLILATFGFKPLKQINPALWRFTMAWTLLIPVLIYMPIGLQRRLIEGFQVPLVTLTILGLSTINYSYRRWLTILLLSLIFPSSLMLFTGAIQSASHTTEPVFLPADELVVFDWLNQNAQPGEVVLSSYRTGNAVPVYTPLVSFFGHTVETVFYDKKLTQVVAFYQPETNNNERLGLISAGRIAYIFFGPQERKLGALDPSSLPYLKKRFEYGDYAIYQVIP